MYLQLCEGAEAVRVGVVLTAGKARTQNEKSCNLLVVTGDLCLNVLFHAQSVKTM